ncbi:uncharacterized protein METZ01_LOCUS514584 [marine metagenome]|uniref:Uncharacterized protein n=1 Tax=marine metagenome TaxID=408172 RepID=A0A383EZP9_9ZZZZ
MRGPSEPFHHDLILQKTICPPLSDFPFKRRERRM